MRILVKAGVPIGNTPEWANKAGGYGIQGKGALFVKSIRGDFYTVMGLPISQVYRKLKEFESIIKDAD